MSAELIRYGTATRKYDNCKINSFCILCYFMAESIAAIR